jgi:hypothetical protein
MPHCSHPLTAIARLARLLTGLYPRRRGREKAHLKSYLASGTIAGLKPDLKT